MQGDPPDHIGARRNEGGWMDLWLVFREILDGHAAA
jgi:hypothetical protein